MSAMVFNLLKIIGLHSRSHCTSKISVTRDYVTFAGRKQIFQHFTREENFKVFCQHRYCRLGKSRAKDSS